MNLKQSLIKLRKTIMKEQQVNDEIINQSFIESSSQDSESIIDKKLEQATINFFPKEGIWYSNCFRKSKVLEMGNLPCNLRDNEWLAMMLRDDQKLYYISHSRILKFVSTSPFFAEQRHKYELEIVRWQINWMKNDGENWVCDEKYGGDFGLIMPTCDLWFRKGIVDTLSEIGMDLEVVEEGIEKHADLWRDTYMNLAFKNEFEPVFYQNSKAEDEHRENWLKMRRYQYYQRHKKSVEKYGIITEDMAMTEEEAEKLEEYLYTKATERHGILEQEKQKRISMFPR